MLIVGRGDGAARDEVMGDEVMREKEVMRERGDEVMGCWGDEA